MDVHRRDTATRKLNVPVTNLRHSQQSDTLDIQEMLESSWTGSGAEIDKTQHVRQVFAVNLTDGLQHKNKNGMYRNPKSFAMNATYWFETARRVVSMYSCSAEGGKLCSQF